MRGNPVFLPGTLPRLLGRDRDRHPHRAAPGVAPAVFVREVASNRDREIPKPMVGAATLGVELTTGALDTFLTRFFAA